MVRTGRVCGEDRGRGVVRTGRGRVRAGKGRGMVRTGRGVW